MMGFFDVLKRAILPEAVSPGKTYQTGGGGDPEPPSAKKTTFGLAATPDQVEAIRAGLNFVKHQRGFKTQSEAALFLIDKYKAHHERSLAERGIPTIRSAVSNPQPVSEPQRHDWKREHRRQAVDAPKAPPVTLASRAEIEGRIEYCRDTLKAVRAGHLPMFMQDQWQEVLEANQRLLALIASGLRLENKTTAGVLVEGMFYYRAGSGKMREVGEPNSESREMDVAEFILMATERSMSRDIAAGRA